MKNKRLLYLIPIAMCLVVFFGYRWTVGMSQDTKAPSISAEGELILSVSQGQDALLQGVTATDDKDGDVTAGILVEKIKMLDKKGTFQVTYAAFDKAGNVSKLNRQGRYTDYTGPRFTFSGPMCFQEKSYIDLLSFIGATDPLQGDLSRWVRASMLEGSSITALGTHRVLLTVTGAMGETEKLEIPVEVYPAGTYQGKLELQEYIVYLKQGSRFDARSYLKSFTLFNQTTQLPGRLAEGFSLTLTGQVDTATPGVYALGYTVTYDRQGTNYSGYSKLIVVVEEG